MVPDLIDDVKKIFEFQSFSYIRVCFTPTTIIFKWWDFNEFQLHVPIEKSMANQDIYDFSHHGSTSNSCEKLNLRCLGDKLCKKLPPAMYVHIAIFFQFVQGDHVLHLPFIKYHQFSTLHLSLVLPWWEKSYISRFFYWCIKYNVK